MNDQAHLAAMGLPMLTQGPNINIPLSPTESFANDAAGISVNVLPQMTEEIYSDQQTIHGQGNWCKTIRLFYNRYKLWTTLENQISIEFRLEIEALTGKKMPVHWRNFHPWLDARLRRFELELAGVSSLLEKAESLVLASSMGAQNRNVHLETFLYAYPSLRRRRTHERYVRLAINNALG
ncbi:hypothetical protein NM208_g5622 [Fusarium decemcellulare]|uniref:Uncharacterized protein n=1 Tax=Fusarium decemcellulare TaxID=57161 RepID=A0ACC1SGA8_9HYPO|nr:hypothetical protein NM208_g5622 [Fusarium decemcellulare]